MKYDAEILWPNGEGYTPCSSEYVVASDDRDAIFMPGVDVGTLEDLLPEDYEAYCRLSDRLLGLQAEGHLGKGVRY